MYNENDNYERKDFSLLKGFIMRLILIIIFVLLLIKFVPWPDMSGLAPLQEQIFANNLEKMKEAGLLYFTEERLPQNVGDKKTITLGEMLDKKLLIPFTDKNGNTCSNTESYITIEKVDDDEYNYKMKVNLKCSEEEDYIYVYLGCYSYCEGYICEKEEESETTTKPVASSKPTASSSPKPTTTTTPTPTTTPKPTPTVTPKPTTTPTPTESPEPTNSPTPTTTPTPTESPKPTTTPTPTPTTTPKPAVNYEYEYKKTTSAVYSDWSSWKVWTYTDSSKVNWNNTTLYQIEDLGTKKVKVGTRTNTAVVERWEMQQVGTYNYKLCEGYTYEADVNTVYKIETDWADTNEYYKGYNPPADTMTTRWVLQDHKVNYCKGECTNHVYLVYKKQTRKVSKTTTATNVSATCTSIKEVSVPIYAEVPELTTLKTEETLYGYKKFYRDRTRTVKQAATTKYKWSTYNDKTLLNDGWVATGEYRKK